MILDLGLPLIDGFGVVKALREDCRRHIPLIVYTNRDLNLEEKRSLSLGLTTHLVKARTTDKELLTCVKDLLSGLLEKSQTECQSTSKKHEESALQESHNVL